MDEREAVIRSAADHVERTRKRLEDGRNELARLRASLDDTRAHLHGMQEWIEASERLLRGSPTADD
jgi:chromosome segregation ATPase